MSLKYISPSEEGDYENIVYSVSDRTELVFAVSACKDVHVALSEIPGILTRFTYELIIGASENSMTVLRNGINGPTLTQSSTSNILNCSSQRLFWLSWAGGVVSFGSGLVVQQSRVLYYKNPSPHSVNALSVMTPGGVLGNFTFENFAGKFINWL